VEFACNNPYWSGHLTMNCGHCPYCLSLRRNVHKTIIKMEQLLHKESVFVTLTYDPKKYDGETLVKRHTQLFWKSLRQYVSPTKVRYYLVGEYGEIRQRPHYHAIIFGLSIDSEELVRKSWDYGYVQVGDLTPGGIDYVTKYVLKGMHRKKNDKQKLYLGDRIPEFCIPSRRPGLGMNLLPQIAESCISTDALILGIDNQGDVPNSLKVNKNKHMIGTYRTRKLRAEFGFGNTKNPTDWKAAQLQRLSDFIGLDSLTPSQRLSLKNGDYKKLYYDRVKTMNIDIRRGKKL